MNSLRLLYVLQTSICAVFATWSAPTSYTKDGDIIIGGIFPLHQSIRRDDNYSLLHDPDVPICEDYLFRGFRWMQAFLFAIEEINNSSGVLDGFTLGWKVYDSCDSTHKTVSQALDIVRCHNANDSSDRVKVLVGPTSSSNSIAVANILGVYDIPQISYGSTTRSLSAKSKYNSFLRTIPNDNEQAQAMIDLLRFYNWTWVGAIGSDDEYGRQGLATFKQAARDICIEFEEYVSKDIDQEKITTLARRIRDFNATVFVLFMGGTPIRLLSEALKDNGVVGKIWVASEAWATSRSTLDKGGSAMHGTLGIATRGGVMEGFRRFLEGVSPFTQPSNPFIGEFWEKTFNCTCPRNVCSTVDPNGKHDDADAECTGREKFSDLSSGNGYLDWTDSELEKSYTAYLAVHAISHALQDIKNCTDGNGLLEGGKCPDIYDLKPWQLLAYIKKVNFASPGNDENFGFDADGDPNATYKLVSWVPATLPNGTPSNDVTFAHVGNYSKQKLVTWSINTTAIYWRDENGTELTDVPLSVCSLPCKPGYFRRNLVSDCCFECRPCPAGQYTNRSDSSTCDDCSQWDMANENKTACIPKPEEYMRWTDAFGIVFACVSCIGVLLTIFTAIVFIRNRNTPIVKATNVEISFLLLTSLAFCFLTPLIYIAKPEDWTCGGRQVSFVLSLTFCIACILVKTLRVLTAFQATMPLKSRKRSRWLGEHLQILVVVLIALVQVVMCVIWLIVSPPKAEKEFEPHQILIICEIGSLPLMLAPVVYLAILALAAFALAFRARKLPENFNEAKFITFSMLVFFIVWLSFVPAYLSTKGVMATALHCIGILASTFGILGCLFFPKLYVILITPENNTSERLRSATVTHAFRAASKSVIYRINSEKKGPATTGAGESPCPSPSIKNKTVSPSPCVTRAMRQSNPAPTPTSPTKANSHKGNGVSIEINGEMRQSMGTPDLRRNRNNEIRSSLDVKLHVNVDKERHLSELSINSLSDNRKSTDTSSEAENPHEGNSLVTRLIGKSVYQRVPTNESCGFQDAKKLQKSFSFGSYNKEGSPQFRTRGCDDSNRPRRRSRSLST